ncbi:MAG: siderophore ABC transporter substrate-binding protein [Alcaligenaceae bacterium]|nr:siderophore ABC transporter substrate-binding protein [Alcaligenaceae bacterium]
MGGSPAAGQEIAIKHAQGELVLQEAPKRVLVQDVAVIDILDALGVEIAGVPDGTLLYPSYLKKYTGKEYINTGTLQEPNYEAIAAAGADLMIIGGRSAVKFGDLNRILPTIDLTVDNADFLTNVKRNISTLGEIFGKQQRAAELNASIDEKFDQLRAATAANDSTAIVLVTNAGKLGVYGPRSRVSWVFSEAGFKPVLDNIDDRFHGGDAVSFEFILETNPDWLFVIDRDAGIGRTGAAQQLLDNELVRQTTAWKNNQVVYLDPVAAYTVMHGYESVMMLADQVLEAISASK